MNSEVRFSPFNEALFVCPFVLGLTLVIFADKLHIPNQLLAMVYGAVIGTGYAYVPHLQNQQFRFWAPDNILVLCHPIMIAKVGYTLDLHVFFKSIWQVIILSTIGTGLFIFIFGFLTIVMTGRVTHLVNIIAAGTTLAAIDVPEVLMELNRIKNLEVMMDGESIFGSSLCIMTYSLCLGNIDGHINKWYHFTCLYIRFVGGALILGCCIGKIISFSFRAFYHDSYNAIAALFGSCYAGYFLAEKIVFCNGTICTFIIAIFLAKERRRLSPTVDKKVDLFLDCAYNMVELLNCLVLSAYVTFRMVEMYKGFDIAVAICVFIIGNVVRFLIVMTLSPILSRLGLGCNFTTLFTVFWGAKRGSLQLLQVIYIAHDNLTKVLGTELLCFTLVYLLLTFVINMTSLSFILKYFGLIKFTMARKDNITECINMLLEKQKRILFTLKYDRNFSDLNWKLVRYATMLDNPYAPSAKALNDRPANAFETYCPFCYKSIPFASTLKELKELIKSVRMKVLKRQRISLVRQSEVGFIGRTESENIVQNIELALNSKDLKLNIDYIVNLFYTDKVKKKIRYKLAKYKLDDIPLELRRNCMYSLLKEVSSIWYIYLKMFIVCVTIALIIVWMISYFRHGHRTDSFLWGGFAVNSFFIFDFIVKHIVYTRRTLSELYSRRCWHMFELFLFILDIAAFILSVVYSYHYVRMLCLLRVVHFCKLFISLIPRIIIHIDSKIDANLHYAYTFGLALVQTLEDVQRYIHVICKHSAVRELIGKQVQNDKLKLIEMLEYVHRKRPWVVTTLGTCQLKRAILKAMSTSAQEIGAAGYIEEFEYRKIKVLLETAIRKTNPKVIVAPNSTTALIREISWMDNDDAMFEYIYSNIMMRLWEPGDVVCRSGCYLDGVCVIMRGLLKVTYVPTEEILDNLNKMGMLPIRDLLANVHFDEPEEDYLIAGNTIGELSFLTGRPYDCTIEVIQSSCVLVIPKHVLIEAEHFNADPVNGLNCKIWKAVTCQLLYRLLMDKAHYHNVAIYALHTLLNRAFIPDISNYHIIHASDYVDDIFLMDGQLVDDNSKEIYTAPCYIPRSIHQLRIPPINAEAKVIVKPKICIIPRQSIDANTIMSETEELSTLVNNPFETLLVCNSQSRKTKREKAILACKIGLQPSSA